MLHTNGERLKASLLEMGRVGGTPAGGVTRPSLTDTDRQGRDLLASWARSSGLAVRVDDLGNQYLRLEGADPATNPVLIGSHLDTVPLGGKFDGALGVLVGLEVVRTLLDAGIRPRRPIEVVNFSNEEGARFEPAMMSSGVLAGCFTPEYFYSRQDREGKSLGAELERIGYKGSSASRPRSIHAYIEPHIEQGPVLEAEGLALALVEGILGIVWMNVTLTGQPEHAGSSPMRRRRDPLVAAGRIVAGVRDVALEYPDPVVSTVGRLQPFPGVINQISGRVVMSVEMRHPTEPGLSEIAERMERLIRRIAAEERVDAEIEVFWRIAPTVFDQRIVAALEESLRSLGLPYRRMTSGPGHDAKYISEIAPAGMLFVRTVGGRSHCETEGIEWEDAHAAADVVLNAVLRLSEVDWT
ncbi:MAG: Zn-dependent hydrolase [Chloroflexi bacterium]|nr:Zn-dependent hydrolase [Chloroflexota bacterium]